MKSALLLPVSRMIAAPSFAADNASGCDTTVAADVEVSQFLVLYRHPCEPGT